MMPLKAFFILSVLLCGLIIQPTMAARDLAHDTQTKVVAQKSVDAAALEDTQTRSVGYPALNPNRTAVPAPRGQPYTPTPCRSYYGCRGPPSP